MKHFTRALLAASVASILLAGCSSKEASYTSKSSASSSAVSSLVSSEKKKEELILGSESADAFKLTLTNDTSMDLTSFAIKTAGEEEYGANLLPENAVWKNGEKAILYVEKIDGSVPNLSLQIKSADTENTIDVFPAGKMSDSATLKKYAESSLLYVAYDENGAQVITLEKEKAIKTPQTEEAAQSVPAEEPVNEEPVYVDPGYTEEPVYTDPGYTDEPVIPAPVETPAPQAPSQGEDTCLIPAPAE